MDGRTPDTSSGRFGGQWAFLSNPPHHGYARSLPPTSYLPRSDNNSNSLAPPLPPPLYHFSASRTNLNLLGTRPTTSTGGYSSVTIPSQPVLIRVHSANAAAHSRPRPRMGRRRPIMSKSHELPPVSAYSIQGILAAIEEDIEGDLDAIAQIMGRDRLTLAEQYDSHMPPQGEIRAGTRPLQAVEEASASNERLAADNVLILREDASLFEGSHSGSAAYGLLERLQTIHPLPDRERERRRRTEAESSGLLSPPLFSEPPRPHYASALHLPDPHMPVVMDEDFETRRSSRPSRLLLPGRHSNNTTNRRTNPVVSETYLFAGANGRPSPDPPVVSEAGRHHPLYSYDESDIFEQPPAQPTSTGILKSFRARMQDLIRGREIASWLGRHGPGGDPGGGEDAQRRLRMILDRQQYPMLVPEELVTVPDTEDDVGEVGEEGMYQ